MVVGGCVHVCHQLRGGEWLGEETPEDGKVACRPAALPGYRVGGLGKQEERRQHEVPGYRIVNSAYLHTNIGIFASVAALILQHVS